MSINGADVRKALVGWPKCSDCGRWASELSVAFIEALAAIDTYTVVHYCDGCCPDERYEHLAQLPVESHAVTASQMALTTVVENAGRAA